MDCIFCKIRDRKIPKEFTYEDDDIMVFPDIHPVKPIHLLVIPKKHITDFLELTENDILEKIKIVLHDMITENNLEKKGYRIVINGGGAQIIPHLHFHLTGPMGKAAKM